MTRPFRLLIIGLLLTSTGCASLGCEVNPLKPRTALRCEMPLG